MDNKGATNPDEVQHKPVLNEGVLAYIKQELKKGFSEEEIAKMLLKAGYDLRIIEYHSKYISKKIVVKRAFLSIFAILLIAIPFYLYKSGIIGLDSSSGDELEDIERYADSIGIGLGLVDIGNRKISVSKAESQGKSYYKEGDLDKALEIFSKLAELKPNKPNYHRYLGVIYCRKGNYAQAAFHYEEALKLDKNNPDLYLHMARCFEVQGLHGKALEVLNKSLHINLNSTIFS